MDIIGRNAEQSALLECYESGRPEFVAVYGRRRVGKTYLIKETFRDRFDFYATGILGGKTARQLETFTGAVSEAGRKNLPAAKDWFAAFAYLKQHLSGLLEHKRG
ncbi:MAG: hypothetical protein LBT26_06515, partial [Clostridiales Family XIII bacterium]|nr:hypothetical protein [Clostridiales Family XIII bacterium]